MLADLVPVGRLDDNAGHRTRTALQQLHDLVTGQHRHASGFHMWRQLGIQNLQDGTPALDAPGIACAAIGFVRGSRNGMLLTNFESGSHQPVESLGGIEHRQTQQFGIGRAFADLHHIVVVRLRRIVNTARVLQAGTCRTHLTAGHEQRTADGSARFHHENFCTTLRREDRGGQAGVPATDHDQVILLSGGQGGVTHATKGGGGRDRTRRSKELTLGNSAHHHPRALLRRIRTNDKPTGFGYRSAYIFLRAANADDVRFAWLRRCTNTGVSRGHGSMPIGIKRLKYFLAVAEQGNINRAAEALHISQSALTRSIQVLEDNIGAILFERTQRGVKLTPIGERLFEHARRITNTVRSAELDLEQLINASESEIRLGVTSGVPPGKVLDAVFRLLGDMPTVSVTIVDSFYDSLIQSLRLEQLDMALTTLPEGSDRSDLDVEVLDEYIRSMSVYARAGQPLLQTDPIDPQTLSAANWVISGEPHYQKMVDRYLLLQNIPVPKFRLRCTSVTWMKRAILEEDFVALMTDTTVEKEFPSGSVAPLPGTTTMSHSRIGLVTSASAVQSSAVMKLTRELTYLYRDEKTSRSAPATGKPH